jgi:3-hydroxyisobutyrate dehydrogenase
MTTTQLAAPQITPAQPGHSPQTATPVIAFLGTGRMGGPMAANLARAGFRVQAWDRTASHAAALIKDGATAAASPAEAIKGAQILITMLADGPATEQAFRGPDGELDLPHGLILVQMATVGMEWTERFVNTATRYQVSFFDAPVSGSQGPAEDGELVILASGPSWLREAVDPVFAALGRATTWLGPAGNGTRAKLVLNNWLADLAETTAETLSFARQRSSTRSRTPISRRRPLRPAAPSSPSPARCCPGGGASPPPGMPTTTWPPSTPHPDPRLPGARR